MNRLQKKCVIGTVGIHLLLFLILIVGPAFFNPQPKNDNTVLDVIPANLVDAALNSGVQNAQPPPPAQPAPITPADLRPPPPIQPQPRVVPPPQPTPTPQPSLLDRVEKYFTPDKSTVTPDMKPVEKPVKSQTDNVQVNLNKVSRTAPKNPPHTSTPDNSRAINNALKSLQHNLSSATKVDMPGTASVAYANYATVVKSVYEQALRAHLPEQVAGNNEYTKVTITVENDGTVVSSRIISPSGDSAWDNAVQQTLDQVTIIAPFPDGATEKERQYTLSFNPEVEKSLE
jgi:TonB family protein